MPTIFTRIINHEIPARFIYQDALCVSFLDVRPLALGHCLVVPREEIDQWTDLSATDAAHLTKVAHAIGNAQKSVLNPKRIGLMIAGFEVPHVHLHVVPINSMANLDFALADGEPNPDKLDQVRDQLAQELSRANMILVT